MAKLHDLYYFIHYIEMNSFQTESHDFIVLNDIGYLYIGSAEWYPEIDLLNENVFLHYDDARLALSKIKNALTIRG